MVGHGTERTKTVHFVLDEFVLRTSHVPGSCSKTPGEASKQAPGGAGHTRPGKKTPGGAGTHTGHSNSAVAPAVASVVLTFTRPPVKKHRGSLDSGHTRGARTHTGTLITQTNLTTIPTHQRTRTEPHARRPKPLTCRYDERFCILIPCVISPVRLCVPATPGVFEPVCVSA